MSFARLFVVAVMTNACGHPGTTVSRLEAAAPSPLAADAVAGISDPTLKRIVADHWEYLMRWEPTWATTLGDHRYDDQLAPRDAAAIDTARRERNDLIARLRALDRQRLGDVDRDTYQLLLDKLETDRGLDVCRFYEWQIQTDDRSMVGELSYLVEPHTVTAANDARNLIARLRQGPKAIDDTIANLRAGLAAGYVSSVEKVRRAVEQLDRELAKPVAAWAMANPRWLTAPAPDPWPAGERDKAGAALRDTIARQLVPALTQLRNFLRDDLMPKARHANEGLTGLGKGDICYRATIADHIGLVMSPTELHELGRAEIARTDRELVELGKRVLGTDSLAATIAKLRTDRSLYFETRDQILAATRQSLARAKAAIPAFFSVLPKTDCVMREIPDYEAPFSAVAYYRPPHYDGSKPGEYFINTSKPETRARFAMEALTWHESIPGHHLQIAIAQELETLPAFRKFDGSTAFVEGWALYAERLAEEMGLYSGDFDRLGKVSFDAFRAARLVVDTGLHAMGWSRSQVEDFLRAHTALTEIEVANETDRYISWPGQALAYKVGQLEILKLRAQAERSLAHKFDLKAFHAVVLGAGAVTLPVLRERVSAWIARQTS